MWFCFNFCEQELFCYWNKWLSEKTFLNIFEHIGRLQQTHEDTGGRLWVLESMSNTMWPFLTKTRQTCGYVPNDDTTDNQWWTIFALILIITSDIQNVCVRITLTAYLNFQKASNFVSEFIWISENFKDYWVYSNNFLQDIHRGLLVPRNITQLSGLLFFLILKWQR